MRLIHTMSTLKQKNLAKGIIDNLHSNEPKNAKELLVSVGYAEKTATHMPGRTIDQPGVKAELAKFGFSEEAAQEVVAEILLAGDDDHSRLKAADMIFKVFGSYAPEKRQNLNVNVTKEPSERIKKLAEKLNK